MKIKTVPFIAIIAIATISCGRDYSFYGMYKKIHGPCTHPYIHITKMEGFTGKYCLVSLKQQNKPNEKGNQFLGVIEDHTITFYTGTRLHGSKLRISGRISINGNRVTVTTDGKRCIYEKP